MHEVHVACPCCKNKRLFDADPTAVEGIIKIKCPICKRKCIKEYYDPDGYGDRMYWYG